MVGASKGGEDDGSEGEGEKGEGKGGKRRLLTIRVTKSREGRVAGAEFLGVMLKCHQEICQLKDLYPPKRQLNQNQNINWDTLIDPLMNEKGELPDEAARRIEDILNQAVPQLVNVDPGAQSASGAGGREDSGVEPEYGLKEIPDGSLHEVAGGEEGASRQGGADQGG
jgi:hypothetical protein